MIQYLEYLKSIKFPSFKNQGNVTKGYCYSCGSDANFQFFDVINDSLAGQWNIDKKTQKLFSQRESMHCSNCRSSLRLRTLSKAISYALGQNQLSLKDIIKNKTIKNYKIAEINACGDLHTILKAHKNLYYSEYDPKSPKIRKEDMMKLSYKDNFFDIVLTSDTFEHIPNFEGGLREVHRVLKPGGYHIFTIPTINSRKTFNRVDKNGECLSEPSYHGAGEPDNLVVNEFGFDVIYRINQNGFSTSLYFANPLDMNNINFVYVTKKL
jgi:SAM-dependent methyltransferase